MVLGLIDRYFPPLRLAFAYLVPFCQKDVVDKVDFHSWTVVSPELKGRGIILDYSFSLPVHSCQS